MKKNLFYLIFLLLSIKSFSQTYTMTRNLPVSEISGVGTAITGLGDDNPSAALPIGFDFYYFGVAYTQFQIGSNGVISFGSGLSGGYGTTIPNSDYYNSIAFGSGDLHCGRGTPIINYFVSGTSPNRILVVNFKNVQHYSNSSNLTSVQVQLFEGGTGKIELHISNVASLTNSRTIGIQANNLSDYKTEAALNASSTLNIQNELIRFEGLPVCSNILNLTSNQTSICPGSTVVLSSNASPTSNLTFEWYKNNVLFPGHISDTLRVTQGGSYKVKIIDNVAGCQKTSNSLTIANSFSPYLSGSSYKCGNLSAYPSGVGVTYKWFKNNIELSGITTQSITLSDTGSYYAKVLLNGCEISSPSHKVDSNYISPSPFLVFCGTSYINENSSYVPYMTRSWTGPNGFTSTSSSPTLSTQTNSSINGIYSVTVNFGCETKSATVTVTVPQPSITSLSVVTPNLCNTASFNLSSTYTPTKTYSWAGPNNFTSTLEDPTIRFASEDNVGTYSVTVNFGCNTTASSTVNLSGFSPVYMYYPSNSYGTKCGNAQIGGTIYTSPNPTITYSWTGPNGFTSSVEDPQISNLSQSNAGVYTLSATIAQCNATVTATTNLSISNPWVNISSTSAKLCSGSNYTIDTYYNGGITPVYSWSGPNGFTSAIEDPILSNVGNNNVGKYFVQANFGNGCHIAMDSIDIQIGPPSISASSNFYSSENCPGDSKQLQAYYYGALTPTYSWSGPDGYSSSVQNPTLTLGSNSGGTYTVTANFGTCGTSTATTNITISPPGGNLYSSFGSTKSCAGTFGNLNFTPNRNVAANYSWAGPGGFTSSIQNPTITLNSNSGGAYTVTVNYGSCGTYTATTSILVGNPTVDVTSASGYYCPSASASFTAKINGSTYESPASPTQTTYSWSGPGGFASTQRTISLTNLTAANSGFYTLTVSFSGGCTGTYTTKAGLNVSQNPNVLTSNSYRINGCSGDSSDLYVSTNILGNTTGTYSWSGPNGFVSSQRSPRILIGDGGEYTLVSSFSNGCVGTYTNIVKVIPNRKPNLYINTSSSYCTGDYFSLPSVYSSGSHYSYQWTGPNSYSSILNGPVVTTAFSNANTGTYSVSITSPFCDEPYTGQFVGNLSQNCSFSLGCSFYINGSYYNVCPGSNLTIYGSSGRPIQSLSWVGPGGFTSSSGTKSSGSWNHPFGILTTPGTYTLTAVLTSNTNCTGTVTTTSTVFISIGDSGGGINVGSNYSYCEKSSSNFGFSTNNYSSKFINYEVTGPNGYKYFWNSDYSNNYVSLSINNLNQSNAGQYSITATLLTSCGNTVTSTATTNLTVNSNTLSPPSVTGSPNVIEPGQTASLQATGCSGGIIYWNYGYSGNPISVSPPQTKSYFAYCSQNGCTSNISNRFILTVNNCPIVLNLSNTNIQDNFNSGTLVKRANQNTGLIGANNYITGNANVKYLASKIELSPGFKAESGTVFSAEIGGCQ